MLDVSLVNNNFYRGFVRNCAVSHPPKSVALDLRWAARIYMSGAGSIGLFELAIT